MSEQDRTELPDIAKRTLSEIERLANELSGSVHWWNTDWPSTFSSIETVVDDYIRARLHDSSSTKVKELIPDVKARREKLSLSTSITAPIVGISQQILAFGGAGVALTIGFIDKVKHFSPIVQKSLAIVGIFYSELILLSLGVLILYMLQARFRFPSIYFAKIGNGWPFFYYAAITPVSRNPVQSSRKRFDAAVAYAGDLVHFCENVLLESDEDRLRVELQQYFLLMSYQAYVNQFALRLASVFMYGFIGAVITALLMFVLIFTGVL